MKKILLLFLIALSLTAPAQNYQCLQPGVKPFYTNGNGYLRGMRIDSVRTSGSDTIYYPYHTPRGNYIPGPVPLDSTGSSWLGKRVVQHANGIVVFDNMWADSVIIYTQAHTGFTWTLFEDTTNSSYNATVTATDTMTILGVLDSVKYITIEADTNWVVNPSDPVNNFQIILSKNNGFVQVFDLYTFPYRLIHGVSSGVFGLTSLDYYLDLVLGDLINFGDGFIGGSNPVTTVNSIFHIIPFHNPTNMELYNFSVGEVLESEEQQGYGYSETYITTISLDTILSKTSTATTVNYTSTGSSGRMQTVYVSGAPPIITTSYSSGSGASSYDTTLLIDTTIMPEEWNAQYFYHFFPKSNYHTVSECPDTVCIVDVNNISYSSGQIEFETIPPAIAGSGPDPSYIGYSTYVYSIGYGQSASSSNNYTYNTGETTSYIYINNNGSTCGNYASTKLAVQNINAPSNSINIYPNPASTQLTITSTQPITNIIITNLFGQTITSQTNNTEKVQVDVSQLPAGIYFVKVNGSEVRKFVKE